LQSEDVLSIRKTASVQLNMKIDMTVADFYNMNGPTLFVDRLAALLQIPSYLIRIVDVKSGSTIIFSHILETPDLASSDGTTSAASQAQLQNVKNTLDAAYAAGTFSTIFNAPILSYSADVRTVQVVVNPTGPTYGPDQDPNGTPGGETGPNGDNSGTGVKTIEQFAPAVKDWAIAILAAAILLMIVGGAMVAMRRKRVVLKVASEMSPANWVETVKPMGAAMSEKPSQEYMNMPIKVSPEHSIHE
jgi:hypothetical protein